MGAFEIVALFVVMAVLAAIPSSSVALVVARSSTSGFVSGAAVAVGIVLGDLVFVFLAILGMTALAEVMGGFFLILRYMAAAYLIWFGISLLRPKVSVQTSSGRSASSLSASVLSGLIITLGDVKAIFFYASLLPAFVDLESIEALGITTVIAVTIAAVGGVKLGYAYCASRISALVGGLNVQSAVKVAAGGLMVAVGAYLIVEA